MIFIVLTDWTDAANKIRAFTRGMTVDGEEFLPIDLSEDFTDGRFPTTESKSTVNSG